MSERGFRKQLTFLSRTLLTEAEQGNVFGSRGDSQFAVKSSERQAAAARQFQTRGVVEG